MDYVTEAGWAPSLLDPTGARESKPRTAGRTMVIDKGIGLRAMDDVLESSAPYIDMIKLGFGTSPLYPIGLLRRKIDMIRTHGVIVYPGGTLLEAACCRNEVDAFFDMVGSLGFTAIEVSDGTICMSRKQRDSLIGQGLRNGFKVYTEYGKKIWGSSIEIEELAATVERDIEAGAELVIVEGRESGKGVGLYDEQGRCRGDMLEAVLTRLPNPDLLMWEAPLKHQQIELLKTAGSRVNLGNIDMSDIYALECLRRGLRSDTFVM